MIPAAIAFLLLVAGVMWIRQAEVIALVTQISESVPPIPALAGLLLLAAMNALARRFRGRPLLTPGSMLMIFTFLSVSLAIPGPGIARFLFSNLTAPLYYATPENRFADMHTHIPTWFVPKNPSVIKGFYEGSRLGVPWAAWLVPLGLWLVFFTLLWLTLLSMMLFVRRQWMESEKLSFPQLYLPVQIASERGAFFRNPLMWTGFGIAAGFDLINIAHALSPSFPRIPIFFPLGDSLTQKPFDALQGMTLYIRTEMIGLGYLVSLEVSFSVWFFSLLMRAEAVVGRAMAYDLPGFPYPQEQGIGAYIGLAAFLFWGALKPLLRRDGDSEVDMARRREQGWALAGLGAGFTGLVLWSHAAGLALGWGVLFFALVLGVALVYCRIRAETGVPLIWGFPFGQHYDFVLNVAGSAGIANAGAGSLIVLTNLVFLSRGYFPALAACQLEAFRLAESEKINRGSAVRWLIAAVPAGFILSFLVLLVTYYAKGAANIGLWGTWAAVPLFQQAVTLSTSFTPRNWLELGASAAGLVTAIGLIGLRWAWFHCPFHPLGYAMATSYGDLFWAPFLTVWLLKWGILRYGGNRLYTRLIPAFLGLALGHFFIAGVVWGAFGALVPEALPGYQVWFG